MNKNSGLQSLLNTFNELDRDNQMEAIRLLRNLNIRAEPPNGKYHIGLKNKEGEEEIHT